MKYLFLALLPTFILLSCNNSKTSTSINTNNIIETASLSQNNSPEQNSKKEENTALSTTTPAPKPSTETPSEKPVAKEWHLFTNNAEGAKFQFSYPDGWKLYRSKKPGEFVIKSEKEDSSDIFQENVTILMEGFKTQKYTLKSYTQRRIDQIKESVKNIPNNEIAVNAANVNGTSAYNFTFFMNYKLKGNNNLIKIEQYIYEKNNIFYTVSFSALSTKFDVLYPTASEMLNSFKLID